MCRHPIFIHISIVCLFQTAEHSSIDVTNRILRQNDNRPRHVVCHAITCHISLHETFTDRGFLYLESVLIISRWSSVLLLGSIFAGFPQYFNVWCKIKKFLGHHMLQNKIPWCNIVSVALINGLLITPVVWHYQQKMGHDKRQIFIIRYFPHLK